MLKIRNFVKRRHVVRHIDCDDKKNQQKTNKIMKKTIILLIALSLFSCSSDDKGSSSEPTNNHKLKKITSGNQSQTFYYSGNNISYTEESEISGEIYKNEFVYENNKLVKLKRYINNVYQSNNDLFFQYTNEKITTSSGYEDNILFSHQYTYNSLGQMTIDAQYDNGVYNSEETFTYFSNGNIESHSHSAFTGTYYYTYDNKSNPLYFALPESLSKIWAISRNNEISKSPNYTFEYEYNSNNLPTKKITKMNGNLIETELYEYY